MTSSTLQQAIGTQAPVHEYKDLHGVSQRLAEQAHINLGHEAEVRRAHLDIATLKLEFAEFKSKAPQAEPAPSAPQPETHDGIAKDQKIAALKKTLLQISTEITRAA